MPPSKARPSQGCVPKANEVILKEGLAREHLLKRKKKKKIRMWRSSQASAIRTQWKL